MGGKEVLIKSVAQSIPTYIISCFRVPKTLCDELHSMMARFWWGSTNTKRKIHWKKWSQVCLPKELEGLNFRNLELFNKALLAKQVWRLFTNPTLLASRVIKGKYANQVSLLHAPIKANCSIFWRGFACARELLKSGIRKRIGNGKSTHFFTEPWIPKESTFKPIPIPGAAYPENVLASNFITSTMGWNLSKLRVVVNQEEVSVIESIPISTSQDG